MTETEDRKVVLFVDTNGFIQVRDLKDIPWKALFPQTTAVDLMIAPCVIEELDTHKTSTNKRRRDRSRLALQLIEKASIQPQLALELKVDPICVRIVISSAPRFVWTAHPNLDHTKPDDQLVAEALSFGNGAAIFSYDAGPRIRARLAGIKAYEPDAEWLLPIEQTDDQREITMLKGQLKQALSERPNIVAKLEGLDEASEIRLIRPVVQQLDTQKVYLLAQEFLARHPRAALQSSSNSLTSQLYGVSEAEAKRYRESYAAFETKVHDFYANLHQRVWIMGAVAAVNYYVKNDSGVAAEGLRIEFDLEGDGSLIAGREDAPLTACSISPSLHQSPEHCPIRFVQHSPTSRGLRFATACSRAIQ